jgi:hypothetical protein
LSGFLYRRAGWKSWQRGGGRLNCRSEMRMRPRRKAPADKSQQFRPFHQGARADINPPAGVPVGERLKRLAWHGSLSGERRSYWKKKKRPVSTLRLLISGPNRRCSWPVFAHLAGAPARWAFDHDLFRNRWAGRVVEDGTFPVPPQSGQGIVLGSSFIDFPCSVVETLADFAGSAIPTLSVACLESRAQRR